MNIRQFVLLYLFTLAAFPGMAEDIVNVWSGRTQSVPCVSPGKWKLVAGHGRVLAGGNGEVSFNLPPLKAGSFVDAVLEAEGCSRKIRIWSPRLLGFSMACADSRLKQVLGGTDENTAGDSKPDILIASEMQSIADLNDYRICLVFPDKFEFPLKLEPGWREILLCRAVIGGQLSVMIDDREQSIDKSGDFSYVVFNGKGARLVLFSPGFDFDKIENILLIKKLLEEKVK